jgi:hypothetical protein
VGARLQPVTSEPFERSTAQFEEIRDFAGSGRADAMTQSELERELEARVRELKRQLLQDHVDRREGGRALEAVTDAEGQQRPIERAHERTLRTTFGPVSVARFGYGREGADSLHPLDAELNLPPDGYSLELRRQLAREAARGSFAEAVETIHERTGVLVPKRQAEELAVRSAEDFDDYYAAKQVLGTPEPPGQEPILVLSLDGKGIVMRPEDLREATRKKAQARKPHLTARLAPGEKPHAKRMATVATIYAVDRHVRSPEEVFPAPGPRRAPPTPRPRPAGKRVWASVEQEMKDVVDEMFLEAQSRDPRHAMEWVVVVDGNEQQIRLVQQAAKAAGVTITVILDVIHVLEYVWAAGLALHPDDRPGTESWVLSHMHDILRGRASLVAAGMRRSATRRNLAPERRRAVDKAANYLLGYKDFLRYDQALAAGYPIASGVIEGACRHLVNARMNRSGARWSLSGAEAVLRLRSLVKSGDFDDYWTFHEARERERNHLDNYADRCLPRIARPSTARPILRRVK